MENRRELTEFPVELLLQIFGYLPLKDLLVTSLACLSFNKIITEENSLWAKPLGLIWNKPKNRLIPIPPKFLYTLFKNKIGQTAQEVIALLVNCKYDGKRYFKCPNGELIDGSACSTNYYEEAFHKVLGNMQPEAVAKKITQTLGNLLLSDQGVVGLFGANFLHLFITTQSIPALKCFINAGIEINWADDFGNTPIYTLACLNNPPSNELLEFLFREGADFNNECTKIIDVIYNAEHWALEEAIRVFAFLYVIGALTEDNLLQFKNRCLKDATNYPLSVQQLYNLLDDNIQKFEFAEQSAKSEEDLSEGGEPPYKIQRTF